jgi:hypothetical protein
VQTTVLIKDGSVFVIGGLISDTIKDNNQQVPDSARSRCSAICSAIAATTTSSRT